MGSGGGCLQAAAGAASTHSALALQPTFLNPLDLPQARAAPPMTRRPPGATPAWRWHTQVWARRGGLGRWAGSSGSTAAAHCRAFWQYYTCPGYWRHLALITKPNIGSSEECEWDAGAQGRSERCQNAPCLNHVGRPLALRSQTRRPLSLLPRQGSQGRALIPHLPHPTCPLQPWPSLCCSSLARPLASCWGAPPFPPAWSTVRGQGLP